MHRTRRGFTLVELLIVIGIIGVLMGVLLPAISAARRQAELVNCSVRLRQLAIATLTHAQEHRGYFPLAGTLVGANTPYAGVMSLANSLNDSMARKYSYVTCPPLGNLYVIVPIQAALTVNLGFSKRFAADWDAMEDNLNDPLGVWRAFICPSTRGTDRPFSAIGSHPGIPQGQVTLVKATGAGMGYEWSSNTDYAPNEGVFGYHYDAKFNTRRLNGNTSWIKKSAQVVLFTDAKGRAVPSDFLADPWICWTPSLTSKGPVSLADALAGNGTVADAASFDKIRHRGRINVGFADGHVQTLYITATDLAEALLLPN